MSKISLVVELKLKPGRREAFVARARRHGATCLDTEPGCLRFDVLVPSDGSDRVFLYEVYADQAALDAHGATRHMAQYLEDTADMLVERIRTPCILIDD